MTMFLLLIGGVALISAMVAFAIAIAAALLDAWIER